MTTNQTQVAWQPLPGSQALAIGCPCDEILYHGTRGPGKTEAQLAAFVKNCGRGYGSHWKGVIFDRGYKNLKDVIAKSLVMIPKIFPKAKFLSSKSDLQWTFPDGEVLLFRHIKRPSDYRDYHGQEYPFIGFNELTSYPTSELYDSMKSCSRSGFLPKEHSPKLTPEDLRVIDECDLLDEPYPQSIQERILPDIPLVMFSTTNPHGPGHNWVKRRWIDKAAPGVPIRTSSRVFNPRTEQEETVTTTIVHIFGSYKENRFLDPKYVAFLNGIRDPNKRRAWLGGDWSITSGGALDDLWKAGVHIVPRFIIPKGWRVTRSFDWGSSHPFSVDFWAIANGEEVTLPNGKTFCPARGSRIRIGEIYGCEKIKDELGNWVNSYGTNKGLRLSAREVARQIAEKEEELFEDGWIETKVTPGPADGQIFNVNEQESDSIAQLMASEGIEWERADKSAGSRKNGLEMMRVALENAVQGEGPGLYVMDNCEAFIETVPSLPRDEDDPDDVDCWVAGTLISTPDGQIPIEKIKVGQLVKTPLGLRKVVASYDSGLSNTTKVTLQNGVVLEGTPDHKVYVKSKGLVELSKLDCSDVLVSIDESCLEKSLTTESPTPNSLGGNTTHPMGQFWQMVAQVFTGKCGLMHMEKYLTGTTYTTKTGTQTTTHLKTLKSSAHQHTQNCTMQKGKTSGASKQVGQHHQKAKEPCIQTLKRCVPILPNVSFRAQVVGALLEQESQHKNIVVSAVENLIQKGIGKNLVQFVKRFSTTSHTKQKKSKLAVQSVVGCCERKNVYNLTIEQAGVFYANGVLSSNTTAEDHIYDSTRYMILEDKEIFTGNVDFDVAM